MKHLLKQTVNPDKRQKDTDSDGDGDGEMERERDKDTEHAEEERRRERGLIAADCRASLIACLFVPFFFIQH